MVYPTNFIIKGSIREFCLETGHFLLILPSRIVRLHLESFMITLITLNKTHFTQMYALEYPNSLKFSLLHSTQYPSLNNVRNVEETNVTVWIFVSILLWYFSIYKVVLCVLTSYTITVVFSLDLGIHKCFQTMTRCQ